MTPPRGEELPYREVMNPSKEDLERLIARSTDIVVATPGRLLDLADRGHLSLRHVETVVIDEADQMADMGFLPQVHAVMRQIEGKYQTCLLYTSPSPRDRTRSRMPSSA